MSIGSEADCKNAMKEVQADTYQVYSYSGYPPGCSFKFGEFSTRTTRVTWNGYSTGQSGSTIREICTDKGKLLRFLQLTKYTKLYLLSKISLQTSTLFFNLIDGFEPQLPLRPSDGCPKGTTGCYTFGCPNTCYCEDHCSWEKCFLATPPERCLSGTDGAWYWMFDEMYWTAGPKGKI